MVNDNKLCENNFVRSTEQVLLIGFFPTYPLQPKKASNACLGNKSTITGIYKPGCTGTASSLGETQMNLLPPAFQQETATLGYVQTLHFRASTPHFENGGGFLPLHQLSHCYQRHCVQTQLPPANDSATAGQHSWPIRATGNRPGNRVPFFGKTDASASRGLLYAKQTSGLCPAETWCRLQRSGSFIKPLNGVFLGQTSPAVARVFQFVAVCSITDNGLISLDMSY